MFLIVTKYLIPKGYSALTVFPFVFLADEKSKENKVLINHEKIHIKQQLQLLILPFFLWYFCEYLLRFMKFRHHDLAYRNISFEREAYANESNLNYLNEMRLWSFLNYLKK